MIFEKHCVFVGHEYYVVTKVSLSSYTVDLGRFVPPAYFRGVAAAVRQPLVLPSLWGSSHCSSVTLSSGGHSYTPPRPGIQQFTYIFKPFAHVCRKLRSVLVLGSLSCIVFLVLENVWY